MLVQKNPSNAANILLEELYNVWFLTNSFNKIISEFKIKKANKFRTIMWIIRVIIPIRICIGKAYLFLFILLWSLMRRIENKITWLPVKDKNADKFMPSNGFGLKI